MASLVEAQRAAAGQLTSQRKQIAILDFGSQYSHLIARRIREANVFCELYSCLVDLETLNSANVVGIILSGGPSSVYEEGSPHVCAGFFDWAKKRKLPILGICYGMQEITHTFGGKVAASSKREFGHSTVKKVAGHGAEEGDLFFGLGDEEQMWMSHGDKVEALPAGFEAIASTDTCPFAAIAGPAEQHIYGLQFHPEVTHSPRGKDIIKNFAVHICKAPTDWNMLDIAGSFIEEVRERVGPTSHVIGAVSGGVDSSVAAVLLNQAIGDRFHAVMVDNGCLRMDEGARVVKRLKEKEGIDLTLIQASERFFERLDGVSEPERKRKAIGNLFIEIFQEEAEVIKAALPEGHTVDFLLQGTLYPDVIESVSYKGPAATIKTHHNVGGLPANMSLKLIEPLRELFKDEVRTLGIALGLEPESVWRHPFPGPGLAIRILGPVDRERADKLRVADQIMIDEIRAAGVYDDIAQAFVVLLPCQAVGVMGDCRTYEDVVAVRCVESSDFMTADWYHMDYKLLARISNRIINECRGINRVTYDISSKPPATIEWE